MKKQEIESKNMPDQGMLALQSGRSMVEMLGVLAIVGVLTIGGIAGYRYAINKSNANTILNAVSQMAVTASTELTTQGTINLSEWKDENGNLSINGAYDVTTEQYNDGAFGITVSDMNDEVCQRIDGMDWKVPEDIAINTDESGQSGSCDQGEANTITFVFTNTLGKETDSDEGEDEPETCAFSPCMTCEEDANGNQTHAFLPAGTECSQAGMKGVCDAYGRCKPNEGQSCSSINGCPDGYFCNYGGHSGDYQGGGTPDVCEKVNVKTATVDGVTYYFNTASDLRSWCRSADRDKNCTWGYLAYNGARSWCSSIGKSLLSCAELNAVKNKIPGLPSGVCGKNYWVQGGACRDDNTVWSGRPDGYACAAGVICK
ncbi:MAG: hypothetical protein IJV07_03935 [Alphaproteobacteria bacterium]|nr:hypothetical protein [Alphaproteobacteria bacterium]